MTAGDLDRPEGVDLITPPETMVARVEEPKGEVEIEPTEGDLTAEPEVISKGSEKEEEED
jgi:large subunit ribosomal protein L25